MADAGSPSVARPRWWWRLLAAGAAAIVGYYLIQLASPSAVVGELVSLLFPVIGLGAILAGVALHRPARRLPWLLLAAAEGANLLGDVVGAVQRNVFGIDAYPGPAEALYLLAYPLLATALVLFVRRRTPDSNTPGLLDASMLSLALGLLWWLSVISPLTSASGSALEKAVSVAFPVMDVLLLAIAMRLTVGVGARTRSFALLLASILTTLLADMVYALLTSRNLYGGSDTWMKWAWFLAYLLVGAGALHPSMRSLDRRAAVVVRGISRGRLAVLIAAGLLPAALLLVRYAAGGGAGVPEIAMVAAALFVLMVLRLRGLTDVHEKLVIHDGLTGSYSRRFLDETFRGACAQARTSRRDLAVALVDVDNFALVNEVYGTLSGDILLAEVAARLHRGGRDGDVVGRDGADRFVVLMPAADFRDAALVAERLRAVVSEDRVVLGDDASVRATVSVGLAVMPRDGGTPQALLQAADQALYAAKRAGRNRVYTTQGPVHIYSS
ncbi:GGDEF domain-containing protein [Planosporangium sp. 12N6]|uniref:GGDEF domain-containing protein n=1 Tax=Planosporangium spinosum TaxID=3402278 RepID=UPI003CF6A03F